jgi:energy-coupling factor transporter transmembrane protein EcfT
MIPTIKKINKRFLRILLPLFLILFLLLGFVIIQFTQPFGIYKVETFRISDGWGYRVKIDNKDFIYQPFIPGIPGKKTFPDKKTAARAGNIVKKKLINHKVPNLTKEDIHKIGIDNLGNSN